MKLYIMLKAPIKLNTTAVASKPAGNSEGI
uniref:Uncharacterized protein n=1 Tax=Arundo donax TaxID=35708 RepID=A0A0A9E7Y2_ARUDO